MRVVGLPSVCLVVLAAIALKAGTAASHPPETAPRPDQATARSDPRQDTLTKADKLEIPFVRAAAHPVELVTRLANVTPTPASPPPVVAKPASRQAHEPNPIKVTNTSRDQRIKSPQSKKPTETTKRKNVEPSKPMVDLRPCRRPEGFAGLLRVLNLSPGCDS
jgi:hypothetical protein